MLVSYCVRDGGLRVVLISNDWLEGFAKTNFGDPVCTSHHSLSTSLLIICWHSCSWTLITILVSYWLITASPVVSPCLTFNLGPRSSLWLPSSLSLCSGYALFVRFPLPSYKLFTSPWLTVVCRCPSQDYRYIPYSLLLMWVKPLPPRVMFQLKTSVS